MIYKIIFLVCAALSLSALGVNGQRLTQQNCKQDKAQYSTVMSHEIKLFQDCHYSLLEKMHSLRELTINQANSLDFNKLRLNKEIRSLSVRVNHIENFKAIVRYRSLQSLTIYQSDLYDLLPIKLLKQLHFLSLGDNQISEIGTLSGASIRTLYISDNQLNNLTVKLDELTDLVADSNHIQFLCDLEAPKLVQLSAQNNNIRNIDCLADWDSLKVIRLTGNPIENIGRLKNRSDISLLEIDWGSMTDGDQFRNTPIEIFLPSYNRDWFIDYYLAILVLLYCCWFIVRSKIHFDIYSILIIIPSVIGLGVNMLFEFSITFKFSMYNIIWFQVIIAFAVACYQFVKHKRKISLFITLPILVVASLFFIWLGSILSGIKIL